MTHPMTMAYLSKKELELAQQICLWVSDESIFASFPDFLYYSGKQYIQTVFGYCPEDSGVAGWFRVNEAGLVEFWETEHPDWNRDLTAEENLHTMKPMSFEFFDKLEAYLKYGEL